MIFPFKEIVFPLYSELLFIKTTSQKTLFYPKWIWGSAFVIDSKDQKDQISAFTKRNLIFCYIVSSVLSFLCLMVLIFNYSHRMFIETYVLMMIFIGLVFWGIFNFLWNGKIRRSIKKLNSTL